MKSKLLGHGGLAVLLALALSGCHSLAPTTEPLHGKITIKGSNTFGEELGRKLIADYKVHQPDVGFELETRGSTSGLTALLDGKCDIASSSRLADEDELRQARDRNFELQDAVVGSYGVAVIVSKLNPITDLNVTQVRDLFTGRVTDWKAVGGADLPVHVYSRDPVSGTYLGFRELAMENLPYAPLSRLYKDYAELAQAVAQDPSGIGYSSLEMAPGVGVRPLSIGHVEALVQTINEGHYPYARSVRLYTNQAAETPLARDFIRFVQSPRGQEIVSQNGFVPRLESRLIQPNN